MKKFSCEPCNKTFKSQTGLSAHLRFSREHREMNASVEVPDEPVKESDSTRESLMILLRELELEQFQLHREISQLELLRALENQVAQKREIVSKALDALDRLTENLAKAAGRP